MANAEPKCSHCNGWGHEPARVPMERCSRCNGSGRPTAAAPAPLGELEEQRRG